MWVFVETKNAVHIVRTNGKQEELGRSIDQGSHELHFGCDCDFRTVALDWEEVPVVVHLEEKAPN